MYEPIKKYAARYKHDCETCKYLGQSNDWDLYVCCYSDRAVIGTIIIRNGDKGGQYCSGIVFAVNAQNALNEDQLLDAKQIAWAEALKRAKAEGYKLPDERYWA